MNINIFMPTYNRPTILTNSLTTLLENTEVKPNDVWLIDDGSEPAIKRGLFEMATKNQFHLVIHGRNLGIGHSFERIYNLIRQSENLDIACIIESDYIWRKDWLQDCLDVFEAHPEAICIAGTDHPDMYDHHKTHHTFVQLMVEQFSVDLEGRVHMYKPFDVDTPHGKIKIQGVSNSCGCQIIHWRRLSKVIDYLEKHGLIPVGDYWKRMDRAFNKGITHDTRANASDAHMSGTISMYAEMYMKHRGVDLSKNFGFVSICDYSISQHVCGGGVNGRIVPEGQTFVVSPKWNNDYLTKNPRV